MKYRQSYQNLSKNVKQFNDVLGMSLSSFDYLALFYEDYLNAHSEKFTILGKERVRKSNGRKNSCFSEAKDSLCFVLMYLKNNSLQQTLASTWGLTQPRANVLIHYLLPILLKTLEELNFVPSSNSEDLQKLLSEVNILFLDGTERLIQRPKHAEEQKWHYSGKKNTYYKKYSKS